MAMASHFVAGFSDAAHKRGMALRDPAEHEERAARIVTREKLEDALGLRDHAAGERRPHLDRVAPCERRAVKPFFDVDAERVAGRHSVVCATRTRAAGAPRWTISMISSRARRSSPDLTDALTSVSVFASVAGSHGSIVSTSL